jgi:glycosyltransferase involved in cell wall biosynthesis
MRILVTSVPFAPSIGGIESVSRVLAEEFARAGHAVVVATQTPATSPDAAPYRILRRPGPLQLARAVGAADVVLQNNVSLRLGWPLLLQPRTPVVIAHHVWIPRTGAGALAGRAKRLATRHARNVAVSEAIARELDVPATIVGNPYDDLLFRTVAGIPRERDLVFLGRLVSDKGLPVLLAALAALGHAGRRPRLTIVGDGAERAALEADVQRLSLTAQVRFAGALRGDALVAELNAHRVLVVPSTWEEPFGVVVLEGLACGLVPIVARSGGLPDAVGPCGIVVPKGDADALARAIVNVLDDELLRARLAVERPAHLARHTPANVARAYLEVLAAACGRHAGAAADAAGHTASGAR